MGLENEVFFPYFQHLLVEVDCLVSTNTLIIYTGEERHEIPKLFDMFPFAVFNSP